jgi:hypothetical protein
MCVSRPLRNRTRPLQKVEVSQACFPPPGGNWRDNCWAEVGAGEVEAFTARILFLTYGHDAVHMAVLRCAELNKAGDEAGLASWNEAPHERKTQHLVIPYDAPTRL